MTSFPDSPKFIKVGIVLIDAASGDVQRIISLQYNPDSLTRTLQPQGMGEGAHHSEPLRLKGAATETFFKLDAEIDAADQLEFPDQNRNTVEFGVQPQLAGVSEVKMEVCRSPSRVNCWPPYNHA